MPPKRWSNSSRPEEAEHVFSAEASVLLRVPASGVSETTVCGCRPPFPLYKLYLFQICNICASVPNVICFQRCSWWSFSLQAELDLHVPISEQQSQRPVLQVPTPWWVVVTVVTWVGWCWTAMAAGSSGNTNGMKRKKMKEEEDRCYFTEVQFDELVSFFTTNILYRKVIGPCFIHVFIFLCVKLRFDYKLHLPTKRD